MATDKPYINNPFKIGVDGSKLLFQKAPLAALLLALLSAAGAVNYFDKSNYALPPSAPPTPSDPATDVAVFVIVGFMIIVLAFGMLVVGSIINGIFSYTAAQIASGREITFRHALSATFARLWSFVWLQLLTVLKVVAWSLLFIIPGIVMAYRYSLANLSFFDENKKLTGNAAIKDSLALTKGAWLTTFAGQSFLSIITLGYIAPIVDTGSKAILYRQFNELQKTNSPKPKAHALSWVTLAVVILISLAGLAVAAVAISQFSTAP